jgi:hypothetical protein
MGRIWPKIQTNVLATGKTVSPINAQQTDTLQTGIETHVDYGIQLWGCTKASTAAIILRFQNKFLRNIVGASWYVRNADLHRDLNMEMVTAAIRRFARKHEERLLRHENVEAIQPLDSSELLRRLQRRKPADEHYTQNTGYCIAPA